MPIRTSKYRITHCFRLFTVDIGNLLLSLKDGLKIYCVLMSFAMLNFKNIYLIKKNKEKNKRICTIYGGDQNFAISGS